MSHLIHPVGIFPCSDLRTSQGENLFMSCVSELVLETREVMMHYELQFTQSGCKMNLLLSTIIILNLHIHNLTCTCTFLYSLNVYALFSL